MREDNHRDEIKRINVESIANKKVVAFDKLEGNCCFFVWSSYLYIAQFSLKVQRHMFKCITLLLVFRMDRKALTRRLEKSNC